MTRPKKGTEKEFYKKLKQLEPGMKEHIIHHKDNYEQCSKYKRGNSVSKFLEKVNCPECLKTVELKSE